MISDKPPGTVTSVETAGMAIRDLYLVQRQILALFNGNGALPGAGEFKVLLLNEEGHAAWWTLEAGAGVTLDFDTVTQICTITSP